MLKIKEEELRIKKVRIRLKDQELAIDLELVEAKRKLIKAEMDSLKEAPSTFHVMAVKSSADITHCASKNGDLQSPAITFELTQAFQEFAEGLKEAPLPARDVRKFLGDPLDFHRFITDSNDNILNRVKDPMTKLTYLISYCLGQAYESIQSTIIIRPPERAFSTAMTILKEQFGQQYKVVVAHMKLLKEDPRLKEGDPDAMCELSNQMRNCYITLMERGYEGNINNHDTIDKIFMRLPLSTQREFQKRSASSYLKGREPGFGDLMEFVQQQTMMSNTRFGHMLQNSDTAATRWNRSNSGRLSSKNSVEKVKLHKVHNTQA